MITIISFIILLTGWFRACFIEITATTLTAIDIQENLNRTFTPGAIQMASERLIWSTDEENDSNAQAMYREDLFEGDIVLVSHNCSVSDHIGSMTWQAFGCKSRNNSSIPQIRTNAIQQHNAVRQKTLLWPNGRIPYVISPTYANISKLIILEAFKEYRLLTCIRFVPRKRFDFNYIYIIPNDGCYSMVGNNGGRQIVSLGDGCLKKGIIIHELMHVIGFFHEQNRADRDLYVDILWENVKPAVLEQFDKYSPTVIDNLGSPYDYDSVMHYSAVAFSKNGKPTIIPKAPNKILKIGQRRGLSPIDVWKINKLYNCVMETTAISTPNAENLTKEKQQEELEVTSNAREQCPTTIMTVTVPSTSSTHNTMTISNSSTTANGIQNFKISLNLSTSSSPLSSTFTSNYVNNNVPSNTFPVVKIDVTTPATATVAISTTSTSFSLQRIRYCTDRHPYCQTLATHDFCVIYPRFARDYCAFSCRKC